MTLKMIVALAVLAAVTVFVGAQALSDDQKEPGMQMPSQEEMKEMMDKMTKAMTPGEHHRALDRFVGQWDTTVRVWMAGPMMPPMESKGKSNVKWVLNKHFLMEEASWMMMMPDPSNMTQMKEVECQGIGLTGYDNYKNMYTASWADNMSTHLLTMRGAMAPSGKMFTYYGEMDEPMLDIAGRMVKYVTEVIDDDKHVFRIYDLHAGDDYKVLEISYERGG